MATKKQRWWEAFSNQSEQRIFVGANGDGGLLRKGDFKWRSLDALVKEANLTKAETEKILNKFIKSGLVVQNEKGDKYAYYEYVEKDTKNKDVIVADQEQRIEKEKKK